MQGPARPPPSLAHRHHRAAADAGCRRRHRPVAAAVRRRASRRTARPLQANPHYRDGAFVNPLPPAPATPWPTCAHLLAGQFVGDEVRVPPAPLPLVSVDARGAAACTRPRPACARSGSAMPASTSRSTACACWSTRCSRSTRRRSPFGPRRFHPPPIALDDLPKIDAVLITHDHYDHLDMRDGAAPGASRLDVLRAARHRRAPASAGACREAQIRDLEWWQEHRSAACASSRRRRATTRAAGSPTATRRCGRSWAVIGASHRFYVSGDTGYSDHFARIGEQLGPFDLAFVKIGAYGPGAPWLDIHMSAEDAVRARTATCARAACSRCTGPPSTSPSTPGTSRSGARSRRPRRTRASSCVTPRIGEMVDADQPFPSTPWYLLRP